MKRFWLVLLSLGLVMAFSASAFAVDVKFSGEYYAAGIYVDKTSLTDNSATKDNTATAFFFQRLRLTSEFVVSPGLSVITRADIMERAWGSTRSGSTVTQDTGSSGTRAENENIAFDYAYLSYQTPVGRLQAGWMTEGTWATVFGDNSNTAGRITFLAPVGKFYIYGVFAKLADSSNTAINTSSSMNADKDKYAVAVWYQEKNWDAGFMAAYYRFDNNNSGATPYESRFYGFHPYFKLAMGPVKAQAEINYFFGKYKKYENGTADCDVNSAGGWFDLTATFGPVYVGGSFVYTPGPSNDTNKKNDMASAGRDYSPALIMFNEDLNYWHGLPSSTASFGYASTTGMTNAYLYQLRVGAKPTAKLDVCFAGTFAQAENLNTGVTGGTLGYVSKDYGYEADLTGTYKITNNLSYMLGFGYFFTGDYFKGTSASNKIKDDYLVVNKLTVTF